MLKELRRQIQQALKSEAEKDSAMAKLYGNKSAAADAKEIRGAADKVYTVTDVVAISANSKSQRRSLL